MTKYTPRQLQTKIWNECKRIVRAKYAHTCYTCGAEKLIGSNLQTGHMIAKKYLPYQFKYDLRFLRPQCMTCNLRYGGMGTLYLSNLLDEADGDEAEIWGFIHSVKEVKKLHKENPPKQKEVIEFYTNLLEEYKKL